MSPSDNSVVKHGADNSLHPKIPDILPRERVFPIQVGGEVFKLSGASLSSDAPSYFSQYFLCQLAQAAEKGEDPSTAVRTLNIDRDPITFRDIALHLQGYHVQPKDGTHFVRLFADAQFYSLPRLMSQLYDESIFISIGHREFQIPRDVFKDPGNSPNFFTLGFGLLFNSKDEVFPGLDREGLFRPPSILPPCVPNRDADVFAELLRLLRGYPVEIRNETHREALLKDARYFHFKGLEQRLIAHEISFNAARQRPEIALRLENVQKSGVSVGPEGAGAEDMTGTVRYARPYADKDPMDLVLQIGGEDAALRFTDDGPRLEFFNDTRTRVAKLLEVIATKIGLPPTVQPLGLLMGSGGAEANPATPGNSPLSEDLVKLSLDAEASVTLDGAEYELTESQADDAGSAVGGSRKRRRTEPSGAESVTQMPPSGTIWNIKTGQWRLHVRHSVGGKSPVECVFEAVRLNAVSTELGRNRTKEFLG